MKLTLQLVFWELPETSHHPTVSDSVISSRLAHLLLSCNQLVPSPWLTKDFPCLENGKSIRERCHVRAASGKLTFFFFPFLFSLMSVITDFFLKLSRFLRTATSICNYSGQASWIHLFLCWLLDHASFSTLLGDIFPSVHWFQHTESPEFSSHLRCGHFQLFLWAMQPLPHILYALSYWKHMQYIHLILGAILGFF